jgi:dihydroneopterin aldolase
MQQMLGLQAPFSYRNISQPRRRVFVRDLVLQARIGVHAHEKLGRQRLRINIVLDVQPPDGPVNDDLRNVVCYDEIVSAVRSLCDAGHIQLVETLAERIMEICLADERVRRAEVTLEKLDVYEDAAAAGVTFIGGPGFPA